MLHVINARPSGKGIHSNRDDLDRKGTFPVPRDVLLFDVFTQVTCWVGNYLPTPYNLPSQLGVLEIDLLLPQHHLLPRQFSSESRTGVDRVGSHGAVCHEATIYRCYTYGVIIYS